MSINSTQIGSYGLHCSRMAAFTIRAAAERLGVGYSTFKRWIHSGRVRTIRTEGGHHRVSEAELDRLSAPRTVKGVMLCDTYSGGKWQFVVDGPHKSSRLMDVHIVRRMA